VSAQTTPPQYVTRDGDPLADREAVLAVWRGNLGLDTHMADKYDWFYCRAPAGAPLMQLLMHAGTATPVGACAAGHRRMLCDGREARAGVMVDLAVTPAHRSLGPALILQQGLFAAGQRELDLLYCFPNPKATPVFKRIGHRHLADMVRYVRVLRHAQYVHRRWPKLPMWLASPVGAFVDLAHRARNAWRWPVSGSLRAQWCDRVPDIASIWESSPKPPALTALRDAAHLRWRFDDAPVAGDQRPFRHLQLFDGETPLAWFATRADGHTLQVHDFWSHDGAQLAPGMIAALLRAARREGYAALSIELATSPEHLKPWLDTGFSARSSRPLYGHWFGKDGDAMPALHLVSADEDE
jgi:hypothetical protein